MPDEHEPVVGLYRTPFVPFGSLGRTGINKRLKSINSIDRRLSLEKQSRVLDSGLPPLGAYENSEDDDDNESNETPIEPTSDEHNAAAAKWIAHVREVQQQESASMNSRGSSRNNFGSSPNLIQEGPLESVEADDLSGPNLLVDKRDDEVEKTQVVASEDHDVFTKIVDFFRRDSSNPDEREKPSASSELPPSSSDKHENSFAVVDSDTNVNSQDDDGDAESSESGHTRSIRDETLWSISESSESFVSVSRGELQSMQVNTNSAGHGESIYEGTRNSTDIADHGTTNHSYTDVECGSMEGHKTAPASEDLQQTSKVETSFITRMSLFLNTEIQLGLQRFQRRESADNEQTRVEGGQPTAGDSGNVQSHAIDSPKGSTPEADASHGSRGGSSGAAIWARLRDMLDTIRKDGGSDASSDDELPPR